MVAGEDDDEAYRFMEELKRARDEAVQQRQITGEKLRKLRLNNCDLRDLKRSLEDKLRCANQQIQLLQTQLNDRQAALYKEADDNRHVTREAMGKLQSENQELRDANRTLKDQLKDASTQLRCLAAKCTGLMDYTEVDMEMQTAGDKLGFLKREYGDLRDAKLALTEQLREANQKLQKETKREGLINKTEEVCEANMTLEADTHTKRELRALESKCSNRAEPEQMENNFARLGQKLKEKNKELQQIEKSILQDRCRKKDHAIEIRVKEAQLREADVGIKNAAQKANQKMQALETKCGKLHNFSKELRGFKCSLEEQLRQANWAQKQEVQALNQKLQALEDEFSNLKRSDGVHQTEKADLEARTDVLKVKLREANWGTKSQAKDYNQKLQALENTCTNLKHRNRDLLIDKSNLEAAIRDLEEKLREVHHERNTIEAKTREILEAQDELGVKLEDAEKKCAEYDALKAEFYEIKRFNAVATRQLIDAEHTSEQVQAQNARLLSANEASQEQVDEMQKCFLSFQDKQDLLQQHLEKANMRAGGLEAANSTLRQSKSLLQQQLKEEKKELEQVKALKRSLQNELQALKAERASEENLAAATEQQLKDAIDITGALEAKLKFVNRRKTPREASRETPLQESRGLPIVEAQYDDSEEKKEGSSMDVTLLQELAIVKTANAKARGEIQTMLEHNLLELKAAHKKMQGELSGAHGEIASLEAWMDDMAGIRKELEELKNSNQSTAKEKQVLENKLETAGEKARVANRKVSVLSQESEKMRTTVQEIGAERDRLQIIVVRKSEELQAAAESIAAMEAEIDKLKSDSSAEKRETEKTLEALKSELSAQERENEKYFKAYEDLSTRLHESKKARRELQALVNRQEQDAEIAQNRHMREAECAQNAIQEISSQLNRSQNARQELEGAVDRYRTMISHLEAETGEIVEYQQKIEWGSRRTKIEGAKLQEALDRKIAEVCELQDALKRSEDYAGRHREMVKQLEIDLARSAEENGRLGNVIEELDLTNAKNLKGLKSEYEEYKLRSKKENEELGIKHAQNTKALKSECSDARTRCASISTELDEYRYETTKLQTANDRLRKKISALEDKVAECNDENETLENKQRKHDKAMATLKVEKYDVESDLEKARNDLRDNDETHMKSRALIDDLVAQVTRLDRERPEAARQQEARKSELREQKRLLERTARDLGKEKSCKSALEAILMEELLDLRTLPVLTDREVQCSLVALKSKLASCDQELRDASLARDVLKNRLHDAQERASSLSRQNEELLRRTEEGKFELGKLRLQVDSTRRQNDQLRSHIASESKSLQFQSPDLLCHLRRENHQLKGHMPSLQGNQDHHGLPDESSHVLWRENDQLKSGTADLLSQQMEHNQSREDLESQDQREQDATGRELDRLRDQLVDLESRPNRSQSLGSTDDWLAATRRENDQLRNQMAHQESQRREQDQPRSLLGSQDEKNNGRDDPFNLSQRLDGRNNELCFLQDRCEDLGKAHQGLVKASRDAAVALSNQLEDRNKEFEDLRRKFKKVNSEHLAVEVKMRKLEDRDDEKEECLQRLHQKLAEATTKINELKPKREQVLLELEEACAARDFAQESQKAQKAFLESLRERHKTESDAKNEKIERLSNELLTAEQALNENERLLDETKSKVRKMALDKLSLNREKKECEECISQLETRLVGSRRAYTEATASKDYLDARLKRAESDMADLMGNLAYVVNNYNARDAESQKAYQNLLDRAEELESQLPVEMQEKNKLEEEVNRVRGKLKQALSTNSVLEASFHKVEFDLKAVTSEMVKMIRPETTFGIDEPCEERPIDVLARLKVVFGVATAGREEAVKELKKKALELTESQKAQEEKEQELAESHSSFAGEKEKLMKELTDLYATVEQVFGENQELLGHLQSRLKDAEGHGHRLHEHLSGAKEDLRANASAKKVGEATATVRKLKEKAASQCCDDDGFAALRTENDSLQMSLDRALAAMDELKKADQKHIQEEPKKRAIALELTLADRDKRFYQVLGRLQQKDAEKKALRKEAVKLKWFLEAFLDEAKQLIAILAEVEDPELDRLDSSFDSTKNILKRLENLVNHFDTEFINDRNEDPEDPFKKREPKEKESRMLLLY